MLLARSLARLLSVDPGYDARDVVLLQLMLPDGDNLAGRRTMALAEILARIRRLPNVVAAGAGTQAPFMKRDARVDIPLSWNGKPLRARIRYVGVTEGFVDALRVRLHEGRLLRPADASTRPQPILVTESFVRRYIRGGRSAVGLQFNAGLTGEVGGVSEIVGVVADVLQRGLDGDPFPTFFVPSQSLAADSSFLTFGSSR